MKAILLLASTFVLTSTALASDHGPVFGYATPVNSQGEVSCDTGIFGRNGTRGTQFSTGTGCGYGVTPHFTINAFLPTTFGSGSLPESRIMPGSEWTAGGSWRFLHSVPSVGKRIESTASLGVVVPALNKTPVLLQVFIERQVSPGRLQLAMHLGVRIYGLGEATQVLPRPRKTDGLTRSPGAVSMAIGLPSFGGVMTSGTTEALRN
jgi:hypothetical protein